MKPHQPRIPLLVITILPILVYNLTSTPSLAPNNFYSSAGTHVCNQAASVSLLPPITTPLTASSIP